MKININTKYLLFSLLVFFITVGIYHSIYTYKKDKENEIKIFKSQNELVFNKQKNKIEGAIRYIYFNIRGIALLPQVKSIEGGNLKKGETNAVLANRFSKEAEDTVQQIYNNLASEINISEVYAVMDGLNFKQGETPFFMYDELIVSKILKKEETKSQDTPEQLENEEYEWFEKNIPLIKAKYPEYSFSKLDDYPLYISYKLRTCDNSQYDSKQKGEVKETEGLILSVPIFNKQNKFSGVISSIIRSNIFEAILLDIETIPVTDKEKNNKRLINQYNNTEISRFKINSGRHSYAIYDRRFKEQSFSKDQFYMEASLSLPFLIDNEIKMAYSPNANILNEKLKSILINLIVKLLGFIVLGLAMFRYFKDSSNKNKRILAIANELKNLKDLKKKISIQKNDESAVLANTFNNVIAKIDYVVDKTMTSALNINKIAEETGKNAELTSGNLSRTIENIEQISQEAQANYMAASEVKNIAEQSNNETVNALKIMVENENSMNKIGKSSNKISEAISLIQEISDQTNLLALNAAIEAARAGVHGTGFAVVSAEIRTLANRTLKTSVQISNLLAENNVNIKDGIKTSHTANEKVKKTTEQIKNLLDKINEISDSSKHQNELLETLNASTKSDAELLKNLRSQSEELIRVSNELKSCTNF